MQNMCINDIDIVNWIQVLISQMLNNQISNGCMNMGVMDKAGSTIYSNKFSENLLIKDWSRPSFFTTR